MNETEYGLFTIKSCVKDYDDRILDQVVVDRTFLKACYSIFEAFDRAEYEDKWSCVRNFLDQFGIEYEEVKNSKYEIKEELIYYY